MFFFYEEEKLQNKYLLVRPYYLGTDGAQTLYSSMLNREEGKRQNFKRKRRKEVRKNKGRSSVIRGRNTNTSLILGRASSKHYHSKYLK
jgi:hypothetical protein